MAAELVTGIIAALKGASSLSTVADNDITLGISRDAGVFPRITVDDLGGMVKATFDTTCYDARTIQITIWHNDQDAIVTLQGAVHTLLDKQKPGLTGASVIGCLRITDFIKPAGFGKDNVQVFQAVSRYRAQVEDTF